MRMTSRTWSSNLGLFSAGVPTTLPCMTPILPSSTPNSSRIRPKNRAFLLKDPFFLDRILVRSHEPLFSPTNALGSREPVDRHVLRVFPKAAREDDSSEI